MILQLPYPSGNPPQKPVASIQKVNVPTSKSGPRAPATVLVVDDDDLARDLIQRFFVLSGFHVLKAESGESAVALIQTANPDLNLAVLDYNMPGMDGIRTFEALRVFRPDLRAVIYTGDPDVEVLNRRCPKGLVCMKKELDTQSLEVLLQHLVQGS